MNSGTAALVGEAVGVDVGVAVGVGVAVASADGDGVPTAAIDVDGVGVGFVRNEAMLPRKGTLHLPKATSSTAMIAITAMPDPPAPSASLVPPSPLQNKLA